MGLYIRGEEYRSGKWLLYSIIIHMEHDSRLLEILQLLASNYREQTRSLPEYVSVPNEILLAFEEEFPYPHSERFLNELTKQLFEKIASLIQNIRCDKQLQTRTSLENSDTWNELRSVSQQVLFMLNEKLRKPDIYWISYHMTEIGYDRIYSEEIFESYAHLDIYDFDCSIEELTHHIGIEPTEACLKGEIRNPNSKYKRVSKNNIWSLRTEKSTRIRPEDHVKKILDLIRPVKQKIISITEKYESAMNVYFWTNHYSPGLHFDKEVLKELAELNLELDLDIYSIYDRENQIGK